MNNYFLIWLNWPEKCFRANEGTLRFLSSVVGADSTIRMVTDEAEFLAELPRATHAIVWQFNEEWFDAAPKLRLLATPGAGRELLPRSAPRGIKIHFGGYHGRIIAESVAGFMLAWCRGFFRPERSLPWGRTPMGDKCYLLDGTKAVILGYGKIGKAIAQKLQLLNVRTFGINRSNIANLTEEIKDCDWLVMALPSDTGTDNLLDAALLSKLPPKAVVINIGRGNSVDEAALLDALRSGAIQGAYLDVFKNEPGLLSNIGNMVSHDDHETILGNNHLPWNLITMPHSSAFCPEYLNLCIKELVDEGLI